MDGQLDRQLFIFDLDGTLAPVGGAIPDWVVAALAELTAAEHRLAIASGKPLYYLTGLCRQAGLTDLWLIGENGAKAQYGIDLPPAERFALPVLPSARSALAALHDAAAACFGDRVWFQPNEVSLTLFFDSPPTRRALSRWLADQRSALDDAGITVYIHGDSFDLSPATIHKGAAVRALADRLGWPPEQTVAVGDTGNDLPLFAVCGRSVAVGFPDAPADLHAGNLREVFALFRRLRYI